MVLDVVLWIGFGIAVIVGLAAFLAVCVVAVGCVASAFAAAAMDREEARQDQ
jgi:hypothetical protein